MQAFNNEGVSIDHDSGGHVCAVDWSFDAWPYVEPKWAPAVRGDHPDDRTDFHVDLGCGTIKKARIGVDRFFAPGATNLVMDLDDKRVQLPFGDNSIQSVISHHALEHIGEGFVALVDEVHRVLVPGGIFRAITPLFPSWAAVCDPDHCRYFMADEHSAGTWDAFDGSDEHHSYESFSVPYMKARFERTHQTFTAPVAPHLAWTPEDARELRVTLRKRG